MGHERTHARSNGHHYSITLSAQREREGGAMCLGGPSKAGNDLANIFRQVGELLAFENYGLHDNVAEWQHR
jgi:hypothetical protein